MVLFVYFCVFCSLKGRYLSRFFLPGRASWAANEMEGKKGSLPVFLGLIAPQEFCFEMDKIKGVSEKKPFAFQKKEQFCCLGP